MDEQQPLDFSNEEALEQIATAIRATASSAEAFAIMKILLDDLPYDWVDKEENWLVIAHQLDMYGETELANLFRLANQHCFRLTLKGL